MTFCFFKYDDFQMSPLLSLYSFYRLTFTGHEWWCVLFCFLLFIIDFKLTSQPMSHDLMSFYCHSSYTTNLQVLLLLLFLCSVDRRRQSRGDVLTKS